MNGCIGPITLRVTNAVNYDYSAGFKPDIEWNEYDLTQNPTDALLPLGDPDEFMLGKAISLITGVKRSARGMNTLSKSIMRGGICVSIDRTSCHWRNVDGS